MPRTEIELTEEQARRLDELAAHQGRTVAEVVQESLQDYFAKTSEDRELAECKPPSLKRLIEEMPDVGDDRDFERVQDFGRDIEL